MDDTSPRPIPHPELLAEIQATCAAAGITETRFGKEAVGDFSFVSDLQAGRECRRSTLVRVRAHLDTVKAGAE